MSTFAGKRHAVAALSINTNNSIVLPRSPYFAAIVDAIIYQFVYCVCLDQEEGGKEGSSTSFGCQEVRAQEVDQPPV